MDGGWKVRWMISCEGEEDRIERYLSIQRNSR
jgi:hypothetical protein